MKEEKGYNQEGEGDVAEGEGNIDWLIKVNPQKHSECCHSYTVQVRNVKLKDTSIPSAPTLWILGKYIISYVLCCSEYESVLKDITS